MVNEYTYRGHRILRCHWADDPHGGKWYVQSYHEAGMQWADEATRHHRTLAEAREYINLLRDNRWAKGDKVQVPHRGRMTTGTVVRHDPGESYQGKRVGTAFYVVDVGEYESVIVPKHKIRSVDGAS